MNQFTGKMVGEGIGQSFGKFTSIGFGTEIIYSFIIISCSLMIYFGTKDLYELSEHKGIKYFRLTFLFFALAYFFRSFIKFVLIYFNSGQIRDIYSGIFYFGLGKITLFIFMYFSSMAIFYLLYSVMWKKWARNSKKIYLFHLLAFAIAISTIIFRNHSVYLCVNFLLLIFVVFTYYISRKQINQKKRKHNLHIIYTLIFFFWIINILDILIPNFFQTFQLFIYLASSGIFLIMLYKVLKKVGTI
ncbi:hypothetical protein HN706_03110 [Candidatus Woesearchaeota archaeon]|nr:hypothetical protein [Candidatus Woesearchaeota archaeon]MBT7474902.1 hypothetical protein [Candidatus Woesearchaeota archaeon]